MDRLNASDLGGSYAPERPDDDDRHVATAKPTQPATAGRPAAAIDRPVQRRASIDQYLKGTHQAVKASVSEIVGDDAVSRGAFLHTFESDAPSPAAPKPAPKPAASLGAPADKTLSRSRNSSARESTSIEFAEAHRPVNMPISQMLSDEQDYRIDDGEGDYRAKQVAAEVKRAPATQAALGSRRSTEGDKPQRRPTVENLMSVHGAETHKPVSMSVSALIADEYQAAFTLHDKDEDEKAEAAQAKALSGRRSSDAPAPKALSQRRNSRDLTSIVRQGGVPAGVAAGHFSLSSLVGDEVDVARQESGPRVPAAPEPSAVEKAKADARAKLRKSQEDAAAEAASKKTYYTSGGVFKPHGATNASLHASVAH